jgi:hypothetical protein
LARAGLTTKYTKDTKLGSGVWGHGMTRKITELGKGSLGPRNDTEDHGIGERMIECWSRGKGQTIVLVLSAAVIDSVARGDLSRRSGATEGRRSFIMPDRGDRPFLSRQR